MITNYLNGHLQAVEYYDQRISNANLQLFTSLKGYGSALRSVFVDSIFF